MMSKQRAGIAFVVLTWVMLGWLFLEYGLEDPQSTAPDVPATSTLRTTPAPQPVHPEPTPANPGLRGCLESVHLLPEAPWLDHDDPRLQGEHLVIVLKAERRVMVFSGGTLRRGDRAGDAPSCWRVALGIDEDGTHPPGPKQRRGDRKTPEGWYRSSDRPWSNFAPAITIHYPNEADADAGLAAGLITRTQRDTIHGQLRAGKEPDQKTALGGWILIHRGGSARDWTWGCIALADHDNLELRGALPEDMRTDVLILP
jgi:hypothetical protein